MKTKNKILASLEIAVVLCSVFLVTLPGMVIAAEQTTQEVSANTITTASEDDFVLDIYGNANEDDTIDMRDLTYVKLIFFGKKPETELADARYDGKIDPLDFIQIKLIILDRAGEITLIDTAERVVTVSTSANLMSLICENEVIRLLGDQDRVVGIEKWTIMLHTEDLPVITKQPCIGSFMPGDVDYEKILAIADQTEGQDIVITYAASWAEDIEDILDSVEGIEVVRFDFHEPDIFVPQLKQLAIMLGEKEKCREYLDWRKDIFDQIEDQIQEIPTEERVKVFFDASSTGHFDAHGLPDSSTNVMIRHAGGKGISEDLGIAYTTVDPEWVLEQDPEVIVSHAANAQYAVGIRLGYHSELSDDDYPKLEEARQELMETYGISGTKAVTDGKVYFITDELMYGPQQPVGVMYLAKWFHPERFDDLEPQEQNREYYEEFMDLEYLGIHVYPEE